MNLAIKYLVDPLEKKLWSFRVNEVYTLHKNTNSSSALSDSKRTYLRLRLMLLG